MNTPPERQGLPARAGVHVKEDPLLGANGRVWPALLRLWTYSVVCGVGAIGAGRAMVTATDKILPALPVRLGSIIVVVVGAGLGAEHVLGRLQGRHRS